MGERDYDGTVKGQRARAQTRDAISKFNNAICWRTAHKAIFTLLNVTIRH